MDNSLKTPYNLNDNFLPDLSFSRSPNACYIRMKQKVDTPPGDNKYPDKPPQGNFAVNSPMQK